MDNLRILLQGSLRESGFRKLKVDDGVHHQWIGAPQPVACLKTSANSRTAVLRRSGRHSESPYPRYSQSMQGSPACGFFLQLL